MFRKPAFVKLLILATFFCLFVTTARALPRDAQAVLNRCGEPLHGDETILENTLTGGRRILHYGRGVLNFDKVAGTGWTFTYGQHGKLTHLDAEHMAQYMPCLKDALADSASASPIVPITSFDRVQVSVKRSVKEIVLYSFYFLVALGIFFLFWAGRPRFDDLVSSRR